MRRSSFAALTALCFALVSGLWLAAAAAETHDNEPATSENSPPTDYEPYPAPMHTDSVDVPLPPLSTREHWLGMESLVEPFSLLVRGKPDSDVEADADADFPLTSSRRTWGLNRFSEQSSTAPALFFADDPKPLFRLPEPSYLLDEPVFRKVPSAFGSRGQKYPDMVNEPLESHPVSYFDVDTWGVHPATPVPTPVPDGGIFDEFVTPAAAEEPIGKGRAGHAVSEDAFDIAKLPPAGEQGVEVLPPAPPKSTAKAQPELRQGEAAKVILDLMETMGRSVLDGTVFDKPSAENAQWLKDLDASDATPREALIQYIRALEAQDQAKKSIANPYVWSQPNCQTGDCPELCDCDDLNSNIRKPRRAKCDEDVSLAAAEVDVRDTVDSSRDADEYGAIEEEDDVESLRRASEELESLANRLERKDNYLRADQLRELAQQLRIDARRVQSPELAELMPPPQGPMPIQGPPGFGSPPPQFGGPAPSFAGPSMDLPAYAPFMPPLGTPFPAPGNWSPVGAQPSPSLIPATPQPTFERSPEVKELESEIQLLRSELRKAKQVLGSRGKAPTR